MSMMSHLWKGYGTSILVGAGVALVAPVVLPAVGTIIRPVAKATVKGGLMLADKVKEIAAEASEQVSDLVAEARAEHSAGAASKS